MLLGRVVVGLCARTQLFPTSTRALSNDESTQRDDAARIPQKPKEPDVYECQLSSVEDMDNLGASLADLSGVPSAGDVIFLFGDLGVGKSQLARSFIRSLAGDSELVVPSPGYLLSQTYTIAKLSDEPLVRDELLNLMHVDLYRLEEGEKNAEKMQHMLDLKASFKTGVTLVEWPQRLPKSKWPRSRLDVHLSFVSEDEAKLNPDAATRLARLIPHGKVWDERFQDH